MLIHICAYTVSMQHTSRQDGTTWKHNFVKLINMCYYNTKLFNLKKDLKIQFTFRYISKCVGSQLVSLCSTKRAEYSVNRFIQDTEHMQSQGIQGTSKQLILNKASVGVGPSPGLVCTGVNNQ